MSIKINDDATLTGIYLAKLENFITKVMEAKTIEEMKELLSVILKEHYQHELDMAAIRLAATAPASKDQRLEAAGLIENYIKTIKGK